MLTMTRSVGSRVVWVEGGASDVVGAGVVGGGRKLLDRLVGRVGPEKVSGWR